MVGEGRQATDDNIIQCQKAAVACWVTKGIKQTNTDNI